MRTKEEILKHVEEVMKEYVDPNVAQHGGKVNVVDFDMESGTLHLQMSGSCSGCAGSTQTLSYGVEQTLTHFVEEVKNITSEDDAMYSDPYYVSDPMSMYDYSEPDPGLDMEEGDGDGS